MWHNFCKFLTFVGFSPFISLPHLPLPFSKSPSFRETTIEPVTFKVVCLLAIWSFCQGCQNGVFWMTPSLWLSTSCTFQIWKCRKIVFKHSVSVSTITWIIFTYLLDERVSICLYFTGSWRQEVHKQCASVTQDCSGGINQAIDLGICYLKTQQ